MKLIQKVMGSLCLVTGVGISSVQDASAAGCALDLTAAQVQKVFELEALGAYDPVVMPRVVEMIPMTFHAVRMDNGAGGITPAQMDQALVDLNAAFVSVGMQFFQPGPILEVHDSEFFFNLDTQSKADALRQVNPAPGTINVYFVPSLFVGQSLCGLSSFSFDSAQGIIMANPCAGLPTNTSTFAHEVGHYFDLFHTHETALGTECPDGSNCTTHGDLVCDTPADPGLNEENVTDCAYNEILRICFRFYAPDPSNLMSFAPESCRTSFTVGQGERMHATLVNQRPELLQFSMCPGDVNGDEVVGLADLQILLFNFSQGGNPPGDLNNDGDVDLADLQILLFNFGSLCAM